MTSDIKTVDLEPKSLEPWNATAGVSGLTARLFFESDVKLIELGKIEPGSAILDVGCGDGTFTRRIAQKLGQGGKVIGIDTAPKMIEVATEKNRDVPNAKFGVQDGEECRVPNNTADVVFLRLTLPHVRSRSTVLGRSAAILKPGGRMVIMCLGAPEQNEFFTLAADFAPARVQEALSLGGGVNMLTRLMTQAGLVETSERRLRALATVDSPESWWSCVRAVTGIESPTVPPQLLDRLRGKNQLTVELLLAMGKKADPTKQKKKSLASAQDMLARARRGIRELTPHEVKRSLKKDEVNFIDIRNPEDLKKGVVAGSKNIPRKELELRIGAEVPSIDATIVTMCQGGSESALAAKTLMDMGYRNVWNLAGGINAWKEAGMPMATT